METEIARDSWRAWQLLCTQGGIEVERRDKDFVSALKDELDKSAASLDEAIRGASTDQLVSAIFRRIAPFAQMFGDIVNFFKAACVQTGRDHWRVELENENLDLKQFESFLEKWSSLPLLVEAPAIDFDGLWKPWGWLDEGSSRTGTRSDDPEVEHWLAEYDDGTYLPFPRALYPKQFSSGLSDFAATLLVAVELIRNTFGPSGHLSSKGHRHLNGNTSSADYTDAFAPGTLAQNETDFWLKNAVLRLDWWRRQPGANRQLLESRLAEFYQGFGRRQFPLEVSWADLQRILALPVWRKRHELYAVWIATQIVGALPDYEIELHNENGSIVFAFKETVIATIRNVSPEIRLVSERRQDLADPVGKGRVAGVQPDFGLWCGDGTKERCILVVEVKHYLRAVKRTFHEALIDYSKAHPKAEVALVNYGPVADLLTGVDGKQRDRCVQLGDLTPANQSKTKEFKLLVKNVVDGTVRQNKAAEQSSQSALVIDVSSSMKLLFNDPMFDDFLRSRVHDCDIIVLADDRIRETCTPDTAIDMAGAFNGAGTELVGVVRELIEKRGLVVVVTDRDGARDVQALIGQ